MTLEMPKLHERIDSHTFFVLDFDRCLGDTDKLSTVFRSVIARNYEISEEVLAEAQEQVQADGGSFDALNYVVKELAPGDAQRQEQIRDRILKDFIREAQASDDDMLMSGARELLRLLNEYQIPFGILTYGGDAWQRAKLEAVGLGAIARIVTDTKEKGATIGSWKNDEGEFEIPEELRGEQDIRKIWHVVLIDDKSISFKGLPEGASGVHVLPHDNARLLPSQKGELPEDVTDRVTQAKGLGEYCIRLAYTLAA